MNYIDIGILVVIAAFLLKGVLRGLLKELCSLLGLLCGGFLALHYQGPLGEVIMDASGWPSRFSVVLAFLVLFLASVIFFGLLGYLLSRFVKLVFLGGMNRVAGAIFGIIQGVLLLALVLFALSLRPLPKTIEPTFNESQLVPPLVDLGQVAMTGSRALFGD
jgi:membrane protein required for colicin V production